MFRFTSTLFLTALFGMSSCSTHSPCENGTDSFSEFLGLTPNTKEHELSEILGESSGGYYNESGTSFIYTYQKNENTPIAVAVNSASFKVETILLEILSVGNDFEKDKMYIQENFTISNCHLSLIGQEKEAIKNILGDKCDESKIENDVISLLYNSSDYKTSVDLRFFPEQEFKCSAIIVNWY